MNADDSQAILPLFPLTGVLLLPGNFLPLNVFESRYVNLVRDALETGGRLGIIQPRIPAADNWGPVAVMDEEPELYGVGCGGRIERHELHSDGRYTIVIRGGRRFRLLAEQPPVEGYRRASVEYLDSAPGDAAIDRDRLLAAALDFSRCHDLGFDSELLDSLSPVTLINSLAAALPFAPVEKQALLEADSDAERAELLLTLLAFGFENQPQSEYSPPVVH